MLLGIDVGGTFTDIVLLDSFKVKLKYKTPTTPDIFTGVVTALDFILTQTPASQIKQLNISTTIITNSVIKKQLAAVQLLVMPGPGMNIEHSFPVPPIILSGYINHLGELCQPVDFSELADLTLSPNIAISGKFSVRNPINEVLLQEKLAQITPQSRFFLASQLSGKLNFIRRTNTTYYALATQQIFANFQATIQQALVARNLTCPVNILKADAGCINLATAQKNPAELIFTGPAASILGIKALVNPTETCIALDIGGTTTDISFWDNQQAILDNKGAKIDSYYTTINSFYHHCLGLAGNSIITVQATQITIGPESSPLPLVLQGKELTVTDILVYLDLVQIGNKNYVTSYLQSNFPELPAITLAQTILALILDKYCDTISQLVEELNRQPVYTVANITQEHIFVPAKIIGVGGAAEGLIPLIAQKLNLTYLIPKFAAVTNAVGAALAKPTLMVNLQANTLVGYYTLSQTNKKLPTPKNFNSQLAYQLAKEHLLLIAKQENLALDASTIKIAHHEEYPIIQDYQQGLAINLTLQVQPGILFSLLEVDDNEAN